MVTTNAEEEIVAGTTGGHGAERQGRSASPLAARQAAFDGPNSGESPGNGLAGSAQFASPAAESAFIAPGARLPGQAGGTDGDTSPNPIVRLAEPEADPAADAPIAPAFAGYLAGAGRLAVAWASDRSLRPSSVCGISLAIALAAAAWFTAGTTADSLYGTAALWLGYLVAAVGRAMAGQTAAQPLSGVASQTVASQTVASQTAASQTVASQTSVIRTPGPGAGPWRGRVLPGTQDWLASVGWCLAECLVYAGLAVGAIAAGSPRMWPVAIALIGLLAAHEVIGAYAAEPDPARDATSGIATGAVNILRRMPTGARVLLIGIVVPVWGPRAALLALLDWAVIALVFSVVGQARRARPEPETVRFLRDDGSLARVVGRLVRGNLLPLPPAVLGLAAVCTVAVLGLRNLPGVLVLGPALVMLLAAPGSSSEHAGRLDWLVPVLLLGAQVVYIAALGPAVGVPGPVTFALCAALLLRYVDLACRGRPVWLARQRQPGQPAAECGAWLGWEGRLLLLGLAAALGIATFAYVALTAYLGVLVGAKIVASGAAPRREYGSDRRGSGGRG
jgi:hypothetical protein